MRLTESIYFKSTYRVRHPHQSAQAAVGVFGPGARIVLDAFDMYGAFLDQCVSIESDFVEPGFLGYRQLWVPFVLPEGAARVEMGVHLSYSALYGMTFISGTDLRFASLLNSNYLDAYLSSLV